MTMKHAWWCLECDFTAGFHDCTKLTIHCLEGELYTGFGQKQILSLLRSVFLREREREREADRQRERQRERGRGVQRVRGGKGEGGGRERRVRGRRESKKVRGGGGEEGGKSEEGRHGGTGRSEYERVKSWPSVLVGQVQM